MTTGDYWRLPMTTGDYQKDYQKDYWKDYQKDYLKDYQKDYQKNYQKYYQKDHADIDVHDVLEFSDSWILQETG